MSIRHTSPPAFQRRESKRLSQDLMGERRLAPQELLLERHAITRPSVRYSSTRVSRYAPHLLVPLSVILSLIGTRRRPLLALGSPGRLRSPGHGIGALQRQDTLAI